MAEPHSDPALVGALKHLAPFMPGVAGAILSLTWGERLTPRQKLAALGVGLAMAFWAAPAFLVVIGRWTPDLARSPSVISLAGLAFGLFGMTLATAMQRVIAHVRVSLELGPLKIGDRHGMDDGASS